MAACFFFFERTHHFIDQIKSLQSISRIQSGATENLAKPESSERQAKTCADSLSLRGT
jgi:hypothetical protein